MIPGNDFELITTLADEKGLNLTRRCVLITLRRSSRSVAEISTLLGVSRSTIALAVDFLEERGLAERRMRSSDNRYNNVTLTPLGRELLSSNDCVHP